LQLNPVKGTAPAADVEFLLSAHRTTKTVTIDETFVRSGQYETNRKIVKAGTILGKVTATGLYAPVKKTLLNGAHSAGDTTIAVDDASFFQSGDTITVGNETGLTVSSVDYDNNIITLSAGLAGNQADDAEVKAENGLETADCILYNTVDLTTAELTFADAAATAVTHAVVKEARVKGANTKTKADLTRIEFR